MQDISEGRQSALPQADIAATEGESIALRIYFVQNGPSNIDYFLFSITTGGTANGIYSIAQLASACTCINNAISKPLRGCILHHRSCELFVDFVYLGGG